MNNTSEEIDAITRLVDTAQDTEQPLEKITVTWKEFKTTQPHPNGTGTTIVTELKPDIVIEYE